MTDHAGTHILFPRARIPVAILGAAAFLGGCPGPGPDDTGGSTPAASATVAVTIKVRAANGAPDNFGLVPGDMIAGARVKVSSTADDTPQSATTDESGRTVIMLKSGSYYVSATMDTHDPYCSWYAGEDVEVADKPVTVKLYDLWVLCE